MERSSDLQRDGLYLEVSDADNKPLLEIFYSDATHQTTMTTLSNDVPLDVVEWAIGQAKELLAPINAEK
jgi:hypothetical protein